MPSQVEIYNMALGNIGSSQSVAALEERSKERIVCSQYWDNARDSVLSEFTWPFATRYETLALLSGSVAPWMYAYQYPTDCLRAMFMTVEGALQPDEKMQPEFETAYGVDGRIILTNQPGAVLAYVARIEDTGRFPTLFVTALSWKLASLIAMPMTATQSMADRAESKYKIASQEAWSAALNESKFRFNHESEFVTVRGA